MFFIEPFPKPLITCPGGTLVNFLGYSKNPTLYLALSRAERGSQVESLSVYFWPFLGPSRQTPFQETRNMSSLLPRPVRLARIFLTINSSLKNWKLKEKNLKFQKLKENVTLSSSVSSQSDPLSGYWTWSGGDDWSSFKNWKLKEKNLKFQKLKKKRYFIKNRVVAIGPTVLVLDMVRWWRFIVKKVAIVK